MAGEAAVLQAGGGNSVNHRAIAPPDGKVLAYLKHLFETHANKDGKWTASQNKVFINNVQQHDSAALPPAATHLLTLPDLDLDGFLAYMTSPASSIIDHAPATTEDLSWPLSSYFISSSHNTYLSGNQLSSDSSTQAYTNVLLRGCRCVEIDVWDGSESDAESSCDGDSSSEEDAESARGGGPASGEKKVNKKKKKKTKKGSARRALDKLKSKLPSALMGAKKDEHEQGHEVETGIDRLSINGDKASIERPRSIAEPRVLHGYTLTKEIPFRDVCKAIAESAFVATDLPLIVSLEVHCSMDQQVVMVDIMKESWGSMLVQDPATEIKTLPSPDELRNKILVKVKYAPPETGLERVESGASGASDKPPGPGPEPDAAANKAKKPSKISPELGKLGIYVQGVSFKCWSQPEVGLPTHVFSLSEKKFLGFLESHWATLFSHNKNYLLRAYPSGLRIGSSNLNPSLFWGGGAQLVALNWQETDQGMMLNEGMFTDTGGYVLKPEGFRPTFPSKPSPNTVCRTNIASLAITFLAARNIPLPPGEKSSKGFNPYIKVELHVEASETAHSAKDAVEAAAPLTTTTTSTITTPNTNTITAVPTTTITTTNTSPSDIPASASSNKQPVPVPVPFPVPAPAAITSTTANSAGDMDPHVRDGEYKLRTETHNGCDLDLKAEKLEFKNVANLLEPLSFLRFTVRDDEFGKDELAAWACVRLDRLGRGYRFIRLLDTKGAVTDGVVLVKVEKVLSEEPLGK